MDVRRVLCSLGIIKEAEAALTGPIVIVALLVPIGLAAATYFTFMTDYFALDDFVILSAVSDTNLPAHMRDAFALPQSFPFDNPAPFWRPLGMLYFFVAKTIFGLHPAPYHMVNLLLHGLNAALLVILVAMLTRSGVVGLIAGSLFAVLPTYDIGVTWISQAFELLGASFALTCMILFAAYLRMGRTSRLLYGGALVAAFLALMSKESTVFLLPMLGPLLFVIEGPRTIWRTRRRTIAELLPFGILAAAFALFVFLQEYQTTKVESYYQLGTHVLRNLWTYLRWMTFPFPSTWGSWVPTVAQATASLLLAAAALAVVFRNGLTLFLLLWLLFALLPFVQFTAGIELRYTYLASFPTAALLALALAAIHNRVAQFALPAAYTVLAVGTFCLVLLFSVQARDYQGWLHYQGSEFQTLLRDVDSKCGSLNAQSHLFVLNSPLFDPFGDRISAAVSLYHGDVSVHRVEGTVLPPLSAFIENKCVLLYADGHYEAISP